MYFHLCRLENLACIKKEVGTYFHVIVILFVDHLIILFHILIIFRILNIYNLNLIVYSEDPTAISDTTVKGTAKNKKPDL